MTETRVLWRRLDVRGHEFAEVAPVTGGWRLSGVALYATLDGPCRLEYVVECDERWITRRCMVSGSIGGSALSVRVERDENGAWSRDGVAAPEVAGCIDIDFAFSPVTNMVPIRRLALDVGASASVRAAWLQPSPASLEPLDQRYTRIARDQYLYESGGGSFRRTITVDPSGLPLDYPKGWVAEATLADSASA